MQIGVDIGGTFTDIVALDRAGRLSLTKVPSTPKDLLEGIAAAVTRVLALAGARPADVERFIHGTTVATNAILEQKGAVTAVLTTEGFEDVLELGRMKRSRMYDLDMDPEAPTFLAPRRRRVGIRERLDARGHVLVPLDEAQVRGAVRAPPRAGACRPSRCATCSRSSIPPTSGARASSSPELAPELSVSLSSEVDPTFREYERLLRDRLRRLPGPGGEALPGRARRDAARPRRAGRAADHALAGRHRVGGAGGAAAGHAVPVGAGGRRDRRRPSRPSAPACATSSRSTWAAPATTWRWCGTASPLLASEGSIGPYPVRTPMVDVNTIGAGGGSIAWIDAAGGLRVGPRSAGAEPGPACYGRGGDEATVTDASVRARLPEPGALRRRRGGARRRRGRAGGRRRRPPARPRSCSPRRPASIAWSTRAWPTRSASSRSSAATTRASSRWWCWAARARCTAPRSPTRWAWPRCSCPRRPASSPPSASSPPPSSTTTRARSQARTDAARPGRRQPLPRRAGRRRARPHARGGRAGRRRCAWRTPPTCATSGQAYELEVPIPAPVTRERMPADRGRVPRRARARVRLRARAAAGGVREPPRGPHVPAARGPVRDARRARATARWPTPASASGQRVLRPGFVPPPRSTSRAAAAAVGGTRWPGPAIVEQTRHHHRDPARRRPRLRGRRSATCGPATTTGRILRMTHERHRPDPPRGAAQPARRHRRRDGADAPQERGLADRQGGARRLRRPVQHATARPSPRRPPSRSTWARCSSPPSASCARSRPTRMRDGDAFLLNDPYDGGTHLPDITLAVPVFADGRVVALACTMCHHQDVGGRTPGSVPTDATELYQEGVIIPPTQLFRAGELDENLFRLLTRNVRLPDVFTGDLMAQVAAGRLGGRPTARAVRRPRHRRRCWRTSTSCWRGPSAHPRARSRPSPTATTRSRTGSTTTAWTSGSR